MVDKIEAKSSKKEDDLKTLVVAQLPTQPTNRVKDDSGVEYGLITIEDAMTEILEIARQLKRGLL